MSESVPTERADKPVPTDQPEKGDLVSEHLVFDLLFNLVNGWWSEADFQTKLFWILVTWLVCNILCIKLAWITVYLRI